MLSLKHFNLLLLLLLCSCTPKTPVIDTTEPSNLSVQIDVATDGSGKVTVTAMADNAIDYYFYMGEVAGANPFVNDTGIYEYTYASVGTYQVEVRAYGSGGRYLKKVKQITVQAEAPPTVGEGYTTPTAYDGWDLVWNDEFTGTNLNLDNWTYEIGDGCPNLCGWGNNELEYYREENTTVADGVLTIEAKEENFGGRFYTSSRLITQGKQAFKYGRVDIRAVLPKGQGIWPALWMLGSNISSVTWPACGEIDIMELVGGTNRDDTVHGTGHWENNNNEHTFQGESYELESGDFADEFHVFSIIWDESQIEWFVDDNSYYTLNITSAERAEFRKEFFFIMNVAVGGNWPGNPNDQTVFPQKMLVDYIRVFQQQ